MSSVILDAQNGTKLYKVDQISLILKGKSLI